MKIKSSLGLLVLLCCLYFTACETDDIQPSIVVSLSTDQLSIFEEQGVANLTVSLTAETTHDVTVELFLSGTAQGNGQDFTIGATNLTIPQGNLSASTTISTVSDTLKEGDEDINISIASASGASVSESENQVSIIIEDEDGAATAQFIINEVLYDPSNSGLDGDANGDGAYSQDGDSFIELYNPSSRDFDLGGYEIWDDTTSGSNQFTFPQGTILPSKKVIVVFGDVDLNATSKTFGGATVLSAGSGLNFNNSGEIIGIKDPTGNFYLSFDSDALSNNPNESYTRNPDITGDFEQHGANTTDLFSPGTKVDGTPF